MKVYIVLGLVIAGLTATAAWLADRTNTLTADLATVESERDEAKGKADSAQALLDEQTAAVGRLQERIERIEEKRQAIAQALRDERNRREALEDTDEEYRRWANGRLPDAVIRMLNDPDHPGNQAAPLPGDRRSGGQGGTPEREDSQGERPPAQPPG